jgi:hypothetical protein
MAGDRVPNQPWNPANPSSVLELEATEGVARERKRTCQADR